MPGIVRKILIFAAVDGLVLQPLAQRGQRPATATKIAYQDNSISAVTGPSTDGPSKSFEAFGVVGLLTVSKASFLITITKREQVAQIQGKPIYVVTETALTPLSSKADADTSIVATQSALQTNNVDGGLAYGGDDSDDETGAVADDVDDEIAILPPSPISASVPGEHKRASSVAEDVMARKGGYGRIAHKWFSRHGWTVDQRRNLGLTESQTSLATASSDAGSQSPKKADPALKSNAESAASIQEQRASEIASNLLPKLLRTTQILFGSSRSFYFSYDYDITRRLANWRVMNPELPLYTQVDPLYFWNRHVMEPFIEAGQTAFVLPLMQGFVNQRSFEMDSDPPKAPLGMEAAEKSSMELTDFKPQSPGATNNPNSPRSSGSSSSQRQFLLTLISRRSIKRGGLRYLRRGIDEDGNTANSVETEQILSDASWNPAGKIHSFVQIRGSIPVYFSQSPYSFKPIPQLQHSEEMNYRAFASHFAKLSTMYGSVQIASLVEKHGPEAIVGDQYQKLLERLNTDGGVEGRTVGFEWFDFHAMCRGMKFENVSHLIDTLAKTLDEFGDTTVEAGKQISSQKGVLRTNCMDCLDRTNVTQSACGRRALELQLRDEGIDLSLQLDQQTTWFNTLWADNGDAISKQYAATKQSDSATRTHFSSRTMNDCSLLTWTSLDCCSQRRLYSYEEARFSRSFEGYGTVDFEILQRVRNLTCRHMISFTQCAAFARFASKELEALARSSSQPPDSSNLKNQVVIDFLLGNVSDLVFEDFEVNLMSGDPGVSMSKLREHAVEMCQKLVVADEQEEMIGGWTFLTPSIPNTIKPNGAPFVETVLILNDAALYCCKFDWNIEKVSSFERVDLQHITSIKCGTYITSTLSATQADEQRNVGLVISYKAGANDIIRVNTRSMSSIPSREGTDLLSGSSVAPEKPTSSTKPTPKSTEAATCVLALKALPARSAVVDGSEALSEIEQVRTICSEIERMALHGQVIEVGSERKNLVVKGDIISLADARKSTGLLEQISHSLKKLVWA